MDRHNTKHSVFIRRIYFEKTLRLLTLLICTLIIPNSLLAEEVIGTLLYWESDGSDIRKFMNTPPYIYAETLGGYNQATLSSQVTNARNQWNGAGIPCHITTNSSSALVKVYGGTLAEIRAIEPGFSAFYAGLTLSSATKQTGVYLYNSSRKYLYTINYATIYVRSDNTYQQNVVTHETGHSVGWAGHISASGNVMYSYSTSVTNLTTRDKRHLNQIH